MRSFCTSKELLAKYVLINILLKNLKNSEYLSYVSSKVPQNEFEETKPKITKLAIGIEGGFDVKDNRPQFDEVTSVVVLPQFAVISLPNPDLPEIVMSFSLSSLNETISTDITIRVCCAVFGRGLQSRGTASTGGHLGWREAEDNKVLMTSTIVLLS